jgi:hypothetical protein
MTAVILTITEKRPNTTVSFLREDWDFIKYIQKFNHFRKRNEPAGWTTSPDLLTRTVMHTFNSKDDLTTFANDPVVAARIALSDSYNSTNGITSTKIES